MNENRAPVTLIVVADNDGHMLPGEHAVLFELKSI
jgi:hypothetical protein